jgi:vitamin B12/bleomycin/antimicrobial peptide transport system ATP-binding/permease protein
MSPMLPQIHGAAAPRALRLAALRDALSLARPFWARKGSRRAWLLLASVVALTLASVALNVQFSRWNNSFYTALQERDLGAFWHGVGVFCGLALLFILAAVYRQYLQQQLQMMWRAWMTDALAAQWLQPGTAYRVDQAQGAAAGGAIDNPDQRLAEDVSGFVSSTLGLGLGLLNAGVTLVSFVGILWALSGSLTLPIFGGTDVPGYMVWVALAYSLAGSGLTQRIGRPLVALNAQQQKAEADFRYELVQIRDHAEAIALARGEAAEQRRLMSRFEAVRDNWQRLIGATKRLAWFTVGYSQVANVFPLVAAAPRYFSKAIELGGLMQTAQAFGQVQGALSWFVDAYGSLADWRATVMRLIRFRDAMQGAARDPARSNDNAGAVCSVRDLQVAAPDGQAVLEVTRLSLQPGERLLIEGASGSGKSSLLRTLAGLWSPVGGEVSMPAAALTMFVPQRPYLPNGSLADALAYPQAATRFSPAALASSLQHAGLTMLAPRLDEAARWSGRLSPGQQQRLQFARLFLHRPAWIFVDEATSALDDAEEQALYTALFKLLPASAVLSIGHRHGLRRLHPRWARVQDGRLQESDVKTAA